MDASAGMKLIRDEDETPALTGWLALHPDDPVVTSEVGRVEVLRVARRLGAGVLTEARAVLGEVDLVGLDRGVQDTACDLGSPRLRTLDALHLASALMLGAALSAFIADDRRLAEAAHAAGLVVTAPGQPASDGRTVENTVRPRSRLDRG